MTFQFRGCQLARKYTPSDAIPFPVFVEPKIDGGRLIIAIDKHKPEGFSRSGNPKPGLLPILEPLTAINGWVFDSEGWRNSWGETMSVFQRANPNPQHLKEFQVFVFDLIPIATYPRGAWGTDQRQRKSLLKNALSRLGTMQLVIDLDAGEVNTIPLGSRVRAPNIVYVNHVEVNNHRDIRDAYLLFREKGFEGAMIKAPQAGYMLDRVGAWRKVKPFKMISGIITRCVEGDGKNVGRLGSFRARLPEGGECGVGTFLMGCLKNAEGTPLNDADVRQYFWDRRAMLIGKRINFKVQDDNTPVSEARHPIFVSIEEDNGQ